MTVTGRIMVVTVTKNVTSLTVRVMVVTVTGSGERSDFTKHTALDPYPHRVVMVTMDHEYRNANVVVRVLVVHSRETAAQGDEQTDRQTDRRRDIREYGQKVLAIYHTQLE